MKTWGVCTPVLEKGLLFSPENQKVIFPWSLAIPWGFPALPMESFHVLCRLP